MPSLTIRMSPQAHRELSRVAEFREMSVEEFLVESAHCEAAKTREAVVSSPSVERRAREKRRALGVPASTSNRDRGRGATWVRRERFYRCRPGTRVCASTTSGFYKAVDEPSFKARSMPSARERFRLSGSSLGGSSMTLGNPRRGWLSPWNPGSSTALGETPRT